MRANAKFLLAPILILSAQTSAWAGEDICKKLAEMNPNYLVGQLRTYSDNVLGKPAIAWTATDLVNLSQNLKNCNNLPKEPSNGPKVQAHLWRNQLNSIAETILPINNFDRAIADAYKPVWKWGKVPSCQVVLNWKREPVWHSDNSAELFGKSFREVTASEAVIIKGFIKECILVGEKILNLNRMPLQGLQKIAEDINKSIDREVSAGKEDKDYLAPSLRIYHNEKRVPLSYLSPTSKKWVEFVNKFELSGRDMRVDDMVNVSRWTSAVMGRKKDDPDTLFAEAVKQIIAKRTFDSNN